MFMRFTVDDNRLPFSTETLVYCTKNCSVCQWSFRGGPSKEAEQAAWSFRTTAVKARTNRVHHAGKRFQVHAAVGPYVSPEIPGKHVSLSRKYCFIFYENGEHDA